MNNMYGGAGQGGYQAGGQKFCAQCGQKLEPGARFCPKCGAPCATGSGWAPPKPGTSPLGQVKELCGGMMSMIFVGLYCLGALLNLCLNFSVYTLVTLVITILFCVGFGMNLYGARTDQLRDTGMTIISGTLLAQMIISSVGIAIGGIVLLVALAKLSSYDSSVVGVIILVILVLAVLLAFFVAYYGGLRKTALSARDIIRTGSGTIETSMFVIVLMCISTVMSLIGLFAAAGLSSALYQYSSLLGSKVDILDSLLGGNAFVTVINMAAQVMAVIILIQFRGAGQNRPTPPTAPQGMRYGQYR